MCDKFIYSVGLNQLVCFIFLYVVIAILGGRESLLNVVNYTTCESIVEHYDNSSSL